MHWPTTELTVFYVVLIGLAGLADVIHKRNPKR